VNVHRAKRLPSHLDKSRLRTPDNGKGSLTDMSSLSKSVFETTGSRFRVLVDEPHSAALDELKFLCMFLPSKLAFKIVAHVAGRA